MAVPAYRGNQPYAFVSYAHADAERVLRELEGLTRDGFRIWYDEGIPAASEWPTAIAEALMRCSHLLVFLSPRAVTSPNVRNEINFGLHHGKPCTAIHLDRMDLTALDPGVAMQLGSTQALLRHRLSREEYARKLYQTLDEARVRGNRSTSGEPAKSARRRHLDFGKLGF